MRRLLLALLLAAFLVTATASTVQALPCIPLVKICIF